MNVTVVSPGSSWILDAIARKVCQADPAHFNHEPAFNNPQARISRDAVVLWDVQNCADPAWRRVVLEALLVGCFTHLDRDSVESFRPHWGELDGVVHMCQRYFDVFVTQGWYPPERMTVLRPGQPVPGISLKPLRIGICQRGGHVGKGKDFLPAVAQALTPEIRAGLHLVFCGQGWGEAYDEKAGCGTYHGISATYLREAHYETLYELVDVLLIPSLWEGGPMSLLEALAAGLPVIAADVGWVPDLYRDLQRQAGPVPADFWVYWPGEPGRLVAILTDLVQRRLDRRAVVEGMSYKHYAAGLLAFCKRLQEMRRASV